MSKIPRWSCAGFTLLEVLVSFAIVAIVLTMIMQLFSGSLRSAALGRSYGEATLLADRKMNEILEANEPPGEEGYSESGEMDGGYFWQANVTPYEEFAPEDENFPLTLYRIEVTVSWGEGERERQVALSTVKSFQTMNGP
jgi:general secretion pathway protein I